jgi:uncharacterized protein YaaN involved in tellurite resistance
MSEVATINPANIQFQNLMTATSSNLPVPTEKLEVNSEVRAAVDAAKKEIDYRNSQSVVFFGSKAQTGLTDISRKMIAGVKNKDVSPASDTLNKIVIQIRGFSLDDLKDGEEPGWFKKKLLGAVSPLIAAMQRYETVESQINVIITNLDKHIGVLMRDVVSLDKMYDEALSAFRSLKVYIQAGEEILNEIDTVTIPALKEAASRSDDPEASMKLNDMQNIRMRIERRVHDLKLTRQVVMQSLPTIRMIQDNDNNLIEKIQSTIVNTVPLWQQQIAMLVTARHSAQAAGAVKSANDLTNDLLTSTAETLRNSNRAVRTEIERGIFDIEAVKSANENVVGAIMDSLSIYEEAMQKRRAAEAELDTCEANLRQALETVKNAA